MSVAARFWSKVVTIARLLRGGEFLRPFLLVVNAGPPSILHVKVVVITRGLSIPALRLPTHVRFYQLRTDDPLDGLPAPEGRDRQLLRARMHRELEDGCEAYVAELDGRVVAYIWVARGRHQLSEVRLWLRLGADEACTYRSYVEPAYRYSWVYPGLATFMFTQLSQRGVRSLFGYGDIMNRHSIRTHERLGYHRVAWACLVTLPGVDVQVTRLAWWGEGIRCHVLRRSERQATAAEDRMARSSEIPAGTANGGFAR